MTFHAYCGGIFRIMKQSCFWGILGLFVIIFGQSLSGQQSTVDEKNFAITRVKAENGEANAQLVLGYYYATSLGVTEDKVEAVKWYRKAADQNLAAAQYNLATCYDDGQGVDQDRIEAVKWYRKAAEQNMAEAQFNLGSCYKHGDGVTQSLIESVKWYRKSAEQKYARAQFNLGVACIRGEGVEQDDVEGYKWIYLASKQGFEAATNSLPKLDAALSQSQLTEGKQRAEDWLKQQKKPHHSVP